MVLASLARRQAVEGFYRSYLRISVHGPGHSLGSAVKTASEFNIDNRMMYSIGVAAKEMKLLDSDVIIGIPLSVSGKSPYFDRR